MKSLYRQFLHWTQICIAKYATNTYRKYYLKKKEMKIRTHITETMTNPKIEVDQTWCPGKVDPFIFDCTHYSMQVSFPSRVTKYLVCPPIPPLSHLAIIMKKDHGNTACRNSTFLPPPTILFYTFLAALSHLPSTLPVHLLSANSAEYLNTPISWLYHT